MIDGHAQTETGYQRIAPLTGREPLVDQLTSQLLAHIRSNNMGPGARLPTTAEMAKSFGVAPPTLREALRRLEATGVVAVRHGVGVFVKSDASRLVFLNPDRLEPDRARLVALIDSRQLIEPTLAERAALVRNDDDLADMAELLEASEAVRVDRAQAGRFALGFHARIAQAAGNQVLSDMLSAILELHVEDQLIVDRLVDDPDRDDDEHVAIFEAIAGRNPQRARRLMQAHLDAVMSSVKGAQQRGTETGSGL